VDAADSRGYLPLARLQGELSAVVLAAGDRPWHGWADLRGRTIAVALRMSAVSGLAKAALADVGLIPGTDAAIQHYRTKVSCLQAVLVGAADVCVLPRFVLPQISEIGNRKLRVVVESGSIHHLVFAAHPRIPATQRAKLRSLIVPWPDTAEGRTIMAFGAWPGFVPADDRDDQEVRDVGARREQPARN
jgi:ABC-type phosphate/phosphonate transport system substrate-binding protein